MAQPNMLTLDDIIQGKNTSLYQVKELEECDISAVEYRALKKLIEPPNQSYNPMRPNQCNIILF